MISKDTWLDLAITTAFLAIYLNKPTSSKNIDKIVIEKNKTSILSGFISELSVNLFHISLNGINWHIINKIAPISGIIQYVPISICLILNLGNNKIDNVSTINVIIVIINVPTIFIISL